MTIRFQLHKKRCCLQIYMIFLVLIPVDASQVASLMPGLLADLILTTSEVSCV